MKCKVLKTALTPWGQLTKDEIIDADGGKLLALEKLNFVEQVKEKPKTKAKKKADA